MLISATSNSPGFGSCGQTQELKYYLVFRSRKPRKENGKRHTGGRPCVPKTDNALGNERCQPTPSRYEHQGYRRCLRVHRCGSTPAPHRFQTPPRDEGRAVSSPAQDFIPALPSFGVRDALHLPAVHVSDSFLQLRLPSLVPLLTRDFLGGGLQGFPELLRELRPRLLG
jgi:hypothetical protein